VHRGADSRCRAHPGQVSAAERERSSLRPGVIFCTKSSKTGKCSTTFGISSVVLQPLTKNPLQGHIELYRSYPPQPDIPRPDHLLPSAALEGKKAQASEARPSDETIESESPLAERETEGKAKRNNSAGPSVELTEALPLVPRGRRVVHKRSAHAVEAPRYEVAALVNCQISELLCADIVFFAVLLLLFPTPSVKRWSGPNSLGMMFQQMMPQKLLGRTHRLLQKGW
jgi:hypothetical protein